MEMDMDMDMDMEMDMDMDMDINTVMGMVIHTTPLFIQAFPTNLHQSLNLH